MTSVRLSIAAAAAETDPATLARFGRALEHIELTREDEVRLAVTAAEGVSDQSLREALPPRPNVHVRVYPRGPTLIHLWGMAMSDAVGGHVAVLDARDAPWPGWVRAWSLAPTDHIVCGPVDPEDLGSRTSLAAYLSEYGQFQRPLPPALEELPGNNIVFPRALLPDRQSLSGGFWKTFHIEHLKRTLSPLPVTIVEAMGVSFQRQYDLNGYLFRRFLHGRCYGGSRLLEAQAPSRAVCLAATPLLPTLRTWRVLRRTAGKTGAMSRFMRAAVPLVLGEVAWAVGEGVGYGAGRGDACDRLK